MPLSWEKGFSFTGSLLQIILLNQENFLFSNFHILPQNKSGHHQNR